MIYVRVQNSTARSSVCARYKNYTRSQKSGDTNALTRLVSLLRKRENGASMYSRSLYLSRNTREKKMLNYAPCMRVTTKYARKMKKHVGVEANVGQTTMFKVCTAKEKNVRAMVGQVKRASKQPKLASQPGGRRNHPMPNQS